MKRSIVKLVAILAVLGAGGLVSAQEYYGYGQGGGGYGQDYSGYGQQYGQQGYGQQYGQGYGQQYGQQGYGQDYGGYGQASPSSYAQDQIPGQYRGPTSLEVDEIYWNSQYDGASEDDGPMYEYGGDSTEQPQYQQPRPAQPRAPAAVRQVPQQREQAATARPAARSRAAAPARPAPPSSGTELKWGQQETAKPESRRDLRWGRESSTPNSGDIAPAARVRPAPSMRTAPESMATSAPEASVETRTPAKRFNWGKNE